MLVKFMALGFVDIFGVSMDCGLIVGAIGFHFKSDVLPYLLTLGALGMCMCGMCGILGPLPPLKLLYIIGILK